jgi:hypothetical protein
MRVNKIGLMQRRSGAENGCGRDEVFVAATKLKSEVTIV